MNEIRSFREAGKGGGTRRMVLLALIFATALVLAWVENLLPPLPIAVPGVKFGLSNIAVMYALFFLGGREALLLAFLKGLFVLGTRGPVAASLSLAGGILSVLVMLLALKVLGERATYMGTSISGAVAHNLGQFAVVTTLYLGISLWVYLPVLLISGVIAGILTATLLRFILPALKRLD